MKIYDPMIQPPSEDWLALDEDDQIELVTAYHEQSRVKIPAMEIHALLHVVVEDQLAEGIEAVQDALERLMQEALDRHEAIHAVGEVLLEHLRNLMRPDEAGPRPHEKYFEDLKNLTAATWVKRTT